MVMTTAMERKARREERRLKEEKRRMVLSFILTCVKYAWAVTGTFLAALWLDIVMWDNLDWALTISWIVATCAIGAALFLKAGK